MLKRLIKVRRDLHKIPEPSFKEYKTFTYIEKFLRNRNIKYKKLLDTGIVAYIKGRDENKKIGFRADIDALPIDEENDFDFKSINKGFMHACGHDFHMSIVLNLADYFSKEKPPISLIFIFQPGEEGAGGALKMIKNGVFDIFGKPDYIFGYHINPEIETGVIAAYPGYAWAGSIEFEVVFHGNGGHGAYPHKAPDLVFAFSTYYNNMQSAISRCFDPQHSLLLSCGKVEGAVKSNVFTNKLIAGCTFRYFFPEDKEKLLKKIKTNLDYVKNLTGCETKLEIISDYIPLYNDPELFEKIKVWYNNFSKIKIKGINNINNLTNMNNLDYTVLYPELNDYHKVTISDDMGYFLNQTNGIYFFLGVNGGDTTGLHTSKLNPDEKALIYGFNFFKEIVLNYEKILF